MSQVFAGSRKHPIRIAVGRRSIAVLLTDQKSDDPTVKLLDFMAELTVSGAKLPPIESSALMAQKQRLSRQMEDFSFGKSCFRDALLGYFGEARISPRRPLALRAVNRVFAKRSGLVEQGVCCGVCHARWHSAKDHVRYVCDALEEPPPAAPHVSDRRQRSVGRRY